MKTIGRFVYDSIYDPWSGWHEVARGMAFAGPVCFLLALGMSATGCW